MNLFPEIDIIVPCYNVENVVEKCIKSLLNLNYKKYNIFLVNDGSTDKTNYILEKYNDFNQINIINHNKNKGLSAARNSGIKSSKSDIICFLDSDMEVKSNWLDYFIKIISNEDIIGVVGDTKLPEGYKANKLDMYLYDKRRGARQFGENQIISFQYFLFNNSCIKRKSLEQTGLFNENITSYGGEDTELAIRLWEKYPKGLRFSSKAIANHCHQRELEDFLISMQNYGFNNLPYLIKIHKKHTKALAWNYTSSFRGYLIFNDHIKYIIKKLNNYFNNYWLTRYLVISAVINGARSKINN
tara:strand:- start:90 stop:989 length:900 start_codon:yes stop_codon:yes gene_type:complete